MSGERRSAIQSVDVGILRFNRELGRAEILLLKRQNPEEPYFGQWALPGLVINGDTQDQSLEAAIDRLLLSPKVGFSVSHCEQVVTVGNAVRDPRGWATTTVYMAMVDDCVEVEGEKQWVDLIAVSERRFLLAFDHNDLVEKIRARLAGKFRYTSIGFSMLPMKFTMTDVITLFSVVRGANPAKGKTSIIQRVKKMIEAELIALTSETVQLAMGRPQNLYLKLKPEVIFEFDRALSDG
ncbi:hypothetical protein D3C77_24400 [compost metagenome]